MNLAMTAKCSLALVFSAMLVTGCGDTNNSAPNPSANAGSALNQYAEPAPEDSKNPVSGKGSVSLRKNFYFVFDGSGSMKDAPSTSSGADQSFSSKILGAKWAVSEFLKKVPEDVNLGLFVFDANGVREVLPLAPNNRAKFLQQVQKIQAKGGTPLGGAISKGSDALEKQYSKQLGYGEYRLIVITDGESTDSLNTGVAKAAKYRIPIYTIGFDMDRDHALRKHSITYRSADSAKQLEQALEQAAGELDMFDPPNYSQSQASR